MPKVGRQQWPWYSNYELKSDSKGKVEGEETYYSQVKYLRE